MFLIQCLCGSDQLYCDILNIMYMHVIISNDNVVIINQFISLG